ncbi:MAG: glycan-binding surface protein [Saprospiraceae bacterium]
MLRTFNIKPWLLLSLMAVAILSDSCKKDDDDSGIGTAVQLLSFGPSPALRGGNLSFIGHNLDQVSSIVLSNNVSVSTFVTKTAELLVITVPEETVDGLVVLKTPSGDITTKTILTISEPIKLTSFSPQNARPGAVVTIEGDYLNLIKEVIFNNRKSVLDTGFISQSKTKIEVRIPDDAQTGKIVISNGMPDPILVESETDLGVVLPSVTQLSPNPVKAGTALTITGADLDLTQEVIFSGGERVSAFTSASATELVLNVPANAKDGAIKLVAKSLVEVETSESLTMVVPTITGISPNPAKNGANVTVTGSNLDLIVRAVFGGDKQGTLLGGSATSIQVQVPADATEGTVTFITAADKSVVSGSTLTLVKPVIASFAPQDIQFNNELTITGNHLDLIATVKFSGGTEVAVSNATLTEIKVNVPVGTASGPITVVARNGETVTSSQSLTILASTSATITSMPSMAKPGDMISIVGVNLDEITEVIFPGNVPATMFGQKTATLIEVFIPLNVARGVGVITLITINGEMILSPPINIQGVDPVADLGLVFFNFDGLNAWWGDAGVIENDPDLTLDGSSYFRVNQGCNGWTGFFWRNGQNNFPGNTIGANVANYVLKFDVNVIAPITGGEFAWRLKGTAGDFWYYWKPWATEGPYQTNGWITITIPLTEFYAGGVQLSDLSTITEDFGVAFNNGSSTVNACIDNVRFEAL